MAARRDYAAARSYALSRSLARRPPRGHLVPPPDRLGLVVARQLTPPPTPRPRPDFDARRRPHCRNDGRRRPRWRRDSRRRKGLLPRDGRLEQMALITTTSFGRVKANGGRTIANNPDSTAYSARLAPNSSPSTLTHIGIRVSIFPTFRERGGRPLQRLEKDGRVRAAELAATVCTSGQTWTSAPVRLPHLPDSDLNPTRLPPPPPRRATGRFLSSHA